MDVFETVNNTQVLVATNWTGMKPGTLAQEVTLGAWGLLPDSDYIISVRAKNEKVSFLNCFRKLMYSKILFSIPRLSIHSPLFLLC